MITILLVYFGIGAALGLWLSVGIFLKMRTHRRRFEGAAITLLAALATSLFWPMVILVELAWSHMQSPIGARLPDLPRPKAVWEEATGRP